MKEEWTLTMCFQSNMGQRYCKAIQIDDFTARSFAHLEPLSSDLFDRMLDGRNFEQALNVLKTKQFRRDLFISEAKRLGMGLADYMEDKEGWHGIDRKERLEAFDKAGEV